MLTLGFFALSQSIFQVVAVASVLPFLSLAATPQKVKESKLSAIIFNLNPELTDAQLLIIFGSLSISLVIIAHLVIIAGDFYRAHYSQYFGHWLRTKTLEKIVKQPYHYFLK